MNNQKKAFTLVEVIVTSAILVILSSIGFYSFSGNITAARDTVRQSDIAGLGSQLSLQKKKRGAYPIPSGSFDIKNNTIDVAKQGKMTAEVALTTAENIPTDPELKIPYLYSVSANKQEYQLAATLEGNDSPQALVKGDYKTVAKDIAPSIVLAADNSIVLPVDNSIDISTSNNLFVLANSYLNLPYGFNENPGSPIQEASTLSSITGENGVTMMQNIDYQSCAEIKAAGKYIGPGTYQIRRDDGELKDESCTDS